MESALAWAADKSLSHLDYQFLAASQELKKLKAERKANQILAEAKQKAELALKKEQQANQQLAEAQRQAKQQIRAGSTILVMSLVGSIAAVGLAVDASLKSQRSEIKALNSSSETLRSSNRLLEALVESMKAGRQLQGTTIKVSDKLEAETANTLQQVIETIQSRLEGHSDEVTDVSFGPGGQTLASASEDKTIKL